MSEKQVEVRGSYRILHETPGHTTYGVWINGGKSGDLTVRREEHAGFTALMSRAGFKYIPSERYTE